MCGIAGIAASSGSADQVPAVMRMVAALAHRGPDDHDVRDFGACVLGNARLAIVDLSERGHMPMCNEDATVWITYNGECYNAPELRSLLQSRGHQFKSTTDTEVILHLYEESGESCAEQLRGMFAFAIWDARQKKLVLVRDRLGIKPLYMSQMNGRILFASEIKALLASDLISRNSDPAGLRAFLQLGHIPPPRTAIKNISAVAPGHFVVWKEGHAEERPYWTFPQRAKKVAVSPEQIREELREILVESCRLQLMSDVPVALFLSGGIDSAILGSLMLSVGPRQLTALTIGFAEPRFDESRASHETADLLGLPHQIIRMDPACVRGSLDNAIWAMDQPTVDGLNAYWISRAAADAGFKVALSGQGADELFGGYESIDWFRRFSAIAGSLRPVPRTAGRYLFDRPWLPFRWRKLSYLVGTDDPFVAAQMAVRVLFLEEDSRVLLNSLPEPADGDPEAASFITTAASESVGQPLLDRIASMDFAAHLLPRLLRDGDAMSMAHGLEVRPIFLDHVLIEYVLSLPASLRLQKKKLLMDATRDLGPPGLQPLLATRPKQTFTFPFRHWLGQDLRSTMEATFCSSKSSSSVLNAARAQDVWRKYVRNPDAVGWSRIWSLFVLARWCETMRVGI